LGVCTAVRVRTACYDPAPGRVPASETIHQGKTAAMYTILISILIGATAGGLWAALELWKTWQMGILLTVLVSLASFILISRIFAKRIEPRFLAVQKQIQAGQTQLAISQLEEMMSLGRWQVLLQGQIHAQIGLLAYSTGDEDRALEHLEKSSIRAPEARLALAALEHRRGRTKQAHEILDMAIRANKKQLLLYHVDAWMYSKEGNRDAAINKLLECQKVEPSNESTQDNLGRLQNGKKLNMKRFGMSWFGLQLEKPPAQLRAAQGMAARKGFRQKPKRRN
jgi:tetratricopeptide (TPR) repeat protein